MQFDSMFSYFILLFFKFFQLSCFAHLRIESELGWD